MAETPTTPPKAQEPATTREELDFDNDNEPEQETGAVSPLGHDHPNTAAAGTAAKPASPRPKVAFQDGHEEIPPQKPPRPLSPNVQAENTLIEAFPSIDAKVVRAVLQASGGKVEPAFNALLGMTDPDFHPEEQAPPQPPRPRQRQPMSQLEADEMYARQLAEQYNSAPSRAQYNQREPGRRAPNRQPRTYDEDEDRDRSFFDDDLPEIGKNIQQGFMETQKRVNSWINNFKKKIDGVEDDEEDLYASSRKGTGLSPGRKNFGPSQSEQIHGIRKSAEAQRRSTEAQRYDADPHEFDANEFERLELKDEETPPPMPPRTSSRAKANPDLFKSQPKPPQSGPVDEVDAAERKNPDPEKSKKWQPLTSVAPNPEEDNDPFSLGDDEEDAKDKGEDVAKDATERLKKQASNSVSAGSSGDGAKVLQESARSGSVGTRDKAAEELLGGTGKTA
ncbi:CUE domain-containing protein 5 [Teratosphaeria destructans]|uniref:CUE domain-containing protein 5 n=1 Tax=Teratosphaeria destructans TaxID=418781 RepID=A0A9W7SWC8_9PEZI|nr:CUE domain-containing protein 5 [Teratosphaeria destructans]